jgi:hypothetical protein
MSSEDAVPDSPGRAVTLTLTHRKKSSGPTIGAIDDRWSIALADGRHQDKPFGGVRQSAVYGAPMPQVLLRLVASCQAARPLGTEEGCNE